MPFLNRATATHPLLAQIDVLGVVERKVPGYESASAAVACTATAAADTPGDRVKTASISKRPT